MTDVSGMQREQPDGIDDEGDELDPRVEIELEKLNTASNDINILEKELDEARGLFRQRLTDAARNLKQLAKDIGNHIDKSRPYFEAVNQARKAQLECQNAAITYERACQLHKGARETISVAEEKLCQNPGMFDAAWQEMLNNANLKIMEAESEKLKNEILHQEAAMAYRQLQERVSSLEKQLRKSISKARPYFDQRTNYLGYLETQKVRVQELENSYAAAKKSYSDSLRNLELISEDIHKKRNEAVNPVNSGTPARQREECYGAEALSPDNKPQSRRRSINRKASEDRIKQVLAQRRFAKGRFRSSLLLDLDVDFDLGDTLDSGNEPSKSPGSKSVDIGCVNLDYYNDYQVLDVTPFMEREKASQRKESSQSVFVNIPSPDPSKYEINKSSDHKGPIRKLSSLSSSSLSSIDEITSPKTLEKIDQNYIKEGIVTKKLLTFPHQFSKIEEDEINEIESNKIDENFEKEEDLFHERKDRLKSDVSVFTEIGELELNDNFDEDETFDSIEESETPRATDNIQNKPVTSESCISDTTQASSNALEFQEEVLTDDLKNNSTK